MSWPPAVATNATVNDLSSPATTTKTGLELGLACELVLAEMHVDKVLASSVAPRPPPSANTTNAVSIDSASVAASAMPAVSDKVNTAAAMGGGGGTASGATAAAPAAKVLTVAPGAAGGGTEKLSSEGSAVVSAAEKSTWQAACAGEASSQFATARDGAAREHLEAADLAILQLEPFFSPFWADDEDNGDRNGAIRRRRLRRGAKSGDGVPPERSLGLGRSLPWSLVVRWWWLRGSRARHAGDTQQALKCFHRCERALTLWSGEDRRDGRGEGEAGDEKAVVVLPYCVVHSRIDVQVMERLMQAANGDTLEGGG